MQSNARLAQPPRDAVLHRFEISLADVDRNVYQDLDLRVARHPSEDNHYLLTRVLAFALEHKEGLAFSKGLSEADEPAIWNRHGDGRVIDWIEVSAPGADRLHRASKACERVAVWCHRNPDAFLQRCQKETIHKAEKILVTKVPKELLDALERKLDRNNRWDLSRNEGVVTIVVGGEAIEATLETVPLAPVG
jgi:uncharacterized protein YaeQ